jgi:hypothetical protein
MKLPRARRFSDRAGCRFSAYTDLRVCYEGYSEELDIRQPDVSTSGMFVYTARHFPEGSVLKVCFRLARTGCQVEARAEVRYCLPGVGVGLEFIEISEANRRAIRENFALSDAAQTRS